MKIGSIVKINEGIHKDKEGKVIHIESLNSSILGEEDDLGNKLVTIELLKSLSIIKIKRKRLNLLKGNQT